MQLPPVCLASNVVDHGSMMALACSERDGFSKGKLANFYVRSLLTLRPIATKMWTGQCDVMSTTVLDSVNCAKWDSSNNA